MGGKDVTAIVVNKRRIGVVGLEEAMDEIAAEYSSRPDGDIRDTLLERLKKKNYIPAGLMEAYGEAFVRAFRKHLGQDAGEEPETAGLEVKILGEGCARCDWLHQAVIDAASRLHLPVDVEHVTDPREYARYRVFGFPALVVGGKVRSAGTVPSREDIVKWISEGRPDSGVEKRALKCISKTWKTFWTG